VTREAKAFTWMPNDGVDFAHAAVAAVCADFLVLDRQWKRPSWRFGAILFEALGARLRNQARRPGMVVATGRTR
jgi:hypothetical protein